jgi:anti-anti-sigma factor
MQQTPPKMAQVPRIAFDLVDEIHPGLGVVLLQASGEIDFAAGPQLRERLLAHIGHARMIVLDLSAATFIDSMAIGVLVGVATRMQELGTGMLSVVCSGENERVLRIFDIAGVSSLIALHRTAQDALAAVVPIARDQQLHPIDRTHAAISAPATGAPSRLGVARQYSPTQLSEQGAPGAAPDSPHRVDELA